MVVVIAHGYSHSLNEDGRWKRKTMTQEVVTSLARQLFPFHGIHHVNERAGESTRERKKKKRHHHHLHHNNKSNIFLLPIFHLNNDIIPFHTHFYAFHLFSYFFRRNCSRPNW